MSDMEVPEGWSEEQFREWIGEPDTTWEGDFEFPSYTVADVHDITDEGGVA